MLTYQVIGPDADGFYSAAYPTPGAPKIMTVSCQSRNKDALVRECDRLNELQVVELRCVMRAKRDRMVYDLNPRLRGVR